MTTQLTLFKSDTLPAPAFVTGVDPAQCRISEYNPRKTRNQGDIDALADHMDAIGFKPDRALYAYIADDGVYEVFAGGNRLFAAQQIAQSQPFTIALWLCNEWDVQTISRFAVEDNRSDGLHREPLITDIWAYYHWLNKVKGWTQQEIADVQGVHQSQVSRRIKWHDTMPDDVKAALCDGALSEGHLERVLGEYATSHIPAGDWPDWDAWRLDVLREAIKKDWSARQLATCWNARRSAVERADELLSALPQDARDEYRLEPGSTITRHSVLWRDRLVRELQGRVVRTVPEVDLAFSAITAAQALSEQRKQQFESNLTAEQQRQQEEQRIISLIQSRWIHGDCLEAIQAIKDGTIRLLLTDPPYGIDFQSNRRMVSGKSDKLQNDNTSDAAVGVFSDMLDHLKPKLADMAHLLVFAHWRTEPVFRALLEEHGYIVRGSLIWVKENHTSGDLESAFAPRHERIIHATKGRPHVSPRIDDVLIFARESTSDHPTEKPTALLRALIESTTQPGQLVCDPFGGSGSTLVAAAELERDWWGAEIDDHHWNQGYRRLNSAVREFQNELGMAGTTVPEGGKRAA